MLGPLQSALSLGLQYPPLAATALRALERLEGRSDSALTHLAPAIVPLLEPYLVPINTSDAPVTGATPEGEDPAEGDGKGADGEEGEAAAKEAFKRIRAEAQASAKRARALRSHVRAAQLTCSAYHAMLLLSHVLFPWYKTCLLSNGGITPEVSTGEECWKGSLVYDRDNRMPYRWRSLFAQHSAGLGEDP